MKLKQYTIEFKQQSVELANELGSVPKASKQLGVSEATIYAWRAQLKRSEEKKKKLADPSFAAIKFEIDQLKKENSELKKVNHILKAAAAFFSQDHLK